MPSLTEAKANAELARLKGELATAEAVELAKREKTAAVARTLTYEKAREIVARHISFPEEVHYDEVMIYATINRLSPVLPNGCIFYLGFTGEFSSGKSYATKLVVEALSDGQMLYDASPAGVVRFLKEHPNQMIGIDEVDDLVKKHSNLESLLR